MVNPHLQYLFDIMLHPNRYDWFVDAPGEFDAAEYLLNHHWEELPAKVSAHVEAILLRSGRYAKTAAT